MAEWTKVEGQDKGKVVLYALSTCGWCRKTKKFLNQLDVAYKYIDVDKLSGEEKKEIEQEVGKWNSLCSYPTLVINDETAIIGFDDDKIMEELG